MNSRKLVLVNPVNLARTNLAATVFRLPPLGLGVIAALTPQSWDVELVDENWEPFTYRKADLVGITAFTPSATRAYEIAACCRERGTPVVMGGIHASACPEEALRFADAVVIGEAETVWAEVLADAEARRLKPIYRGQRPEMAGLPRPRRDLFHPGYALAPVQTSRGCPMDCEFCSVSVFHGRRYRRRPPEEVLDELESIPQRKVFFVDDNIIGYGEQDRSEALQLFRGMVRRRLGKYWICQASVNFADDEEVLHWAGRAGCKVVFLGLEAVDVDALVEVNKRLNLRGGPESYRKMLRRIHRAGIAVLGAFILGMDCDTPGTIRRRIDYITGSTLDAMQFTILTPLPGTRLFDRLQEEGRLLYAEFPQDWDRYDLTELVHRPSWSPPDALRQMIRERVRRKYSWPVLLGKAAQTAAQTRDPMAAILAWRLNRAYRKVVLAVLGRTSPA